MEATFINTASLTSSCECFEIYSATSADCKLSFEVVDGYVTLCFTLNTRIQEGIS